MRIPSTYIIYPDTSNPNSFLIHKSIVRTPDCKAVYCCMTKYLVESGEPKLLLRLFFHHPIKVTHKDFKTDYSVKLKGPVLDGETIDALNEIGIQQLPPLEKINLSVQDMTADSVIHRWTDLEYEMNDDKDAFYVKYREPGVTLADFYK